VQFFVTGASGWIGSAVVPELRAAGHEVVGLARSDTSAAAVVAAGATPHLGDLDDLAGLADAARASDGVVHLAFQHEVAFGAGDFAAAAAADRRAVEAMGAALAGSGRPLVVASGMIGLARGRVASEDDGLVPTAEVRGNPASRRLATALYTLSLSGVGVRSSVVRFAPTVHGEGDAGFVATFADIARQRGVSGYVGDGANRWPAVHVSDAARLVRLAAESAPAGSVLHAAGEEGVVFRDLAAAIARQLGVPTASVAPDDALGHFGYLGLFAGLDSPVSTTLTRDLLGWVPTGPTLLEDVDAGRYTRGSGTGSAH
jgi:nucleoside-diphosphate-sugar epimerase